ncbi:hypothetical protein GCM10027278_01150 [Paralcaligenes ginsengisoli]
MNPAGKSADNDALTGIYPNPFDLASFCPVTLPLNPCEALHTLRAGLVWARLECYP